MVTYLVSPLSRESFDRNFVTLVLFLRRFAVNEVQHICNAMRKS